MADRVSQRRQSNNNFYLSVNTAIVGAAAYVATIHPAWLPTAVISLAGMIICVTWGWSIQSYRTLSRAKFEVIHELERVLPVAPFTDEWTKLNHSGSKGHLPFHVVEVVVPWVFGGIHFVQLIASPPWGAILR